MGGWVAPAVELIYEQGTPELRGQWPRIEPLLELAPSRHGHGDWPHPALALRPPGGARPRTDAWWTAADGDGGAPDGVLHDNAVGRAAALAEAGVTLQLLSPGPSIDACLALVSVLAAGVFAAYNRYVVEYCAAAPERLGAVLQLHGSEPRFSAEEVAEFAGEPTVRAASICLPVKIAPDDRRFEPLWRALERAGLPLLHRPSLCAAVWTPGRLLAYLREAGVLARHEGLRIAFGVDRPGITVPAEVRGRVFAIASAASLAGGSAGRGTSPPLAMWASDYPLRNGSPAGDLALLRRELGNEAERVLAVNPDSFLTGSTT